MNALIEPFFLCLMASIVWAPIVYLLTVQRTKNSETDLADKLWPAALTLAALPTIVAPFAASFGLSLRSAPAALPFSTEPEASPATGALTPLPVTDPGLTIDLAMILSTLASLYFYGFILFLVLGIFRHIWFAYRVGYATPVEEPALEQALDKWRVRINIAQKPRYAFTDVVSSVCVHGFFRPVILMPEALLARVSITDAALMSAHEMAHIKRGDTFLFAFCTIVKAVFWFNPFMQRIAARAALAAEQSADALVIAAGAKRRDYAHCFVEGLKFAAGERFAGAELVPSFTPFDKKSRRERLDAILSGPDASPTRANRSSIIIGITGAVAISFAQAALAVSPQTPKDVLAETPVDGRVTQRFGITTKQKFLHDGIDIAAPRGTPVRAAGDGKVIAATNRYRGQTSWGNIVVIDHGHGLVTRYAHLDSFRVAEGDAIRAGETIGAVGSTGRSTGPHLHFEVIRDGEFVDPTPVVTAAAPLPAPRPLETPTPKPAPVVKPAPIIKASAKILSAPAPMIAVKPLSAPTLIGPDGSYIAAPSTPRSPAPASKASILEHQLEGRLKTGAPVIKAKIKNFINDFDGFKEFEEIAFSVEEIDLETFVEHVTEMNAGFEDLDDIADLQFVETTMIALNEGYAVTKHDDHDANKEHDHKDHKRLERERERAHEQAKKDRERLQRDRERMQRDRERWQQDRERQQSDRAKRQIDREKAQREREIAVERAEKERERHAEMSERDMLKERERAIRQAQKDLDRELAEIERRRAALEADRATN